jgi:hypothetical protein
MKLSRVTFKQQNCWTPPKNAGMTKNVSSRSINVTSDYGIHDYQRQESSPQCHSEKRLRFERIPIFGNVPYLRDCFQI